MEDELKNEILKDYRTVKKVYKVAIPIVVVFLLSIVAVKIYIFSKVFAW